MSCKGEKTAVPLEDGIREGDLRALTFHRSEVCR